MDSSVFLREMKKLGITERQVKNWIQRGYLIPKDAHPGKGYRRQWRAEELRIAKAMVQLQNVGFTLISAADYARRLVETGTGFIDLDDKCTLMIELSA